jgi:hypothetical protein
VGFEAARSAIQRAAVVEVNPENGPVGSVGGEDAFASPEDTETGVPDEPAFSAGKGAAARDGNVGGGFGPLVARDVKTGAVRSSQESPAQRKPTQLAESLDSELAAQTIQSLLAGDRHRGIGGNKKGSE